jgi:hypothetical protein
VDHQGKITGSFECKGTGNNTSTVYTLAVYHVRADRYEVIGGFGGFLTYLQGAGDIDTLQGTGEWDIFVQKISTCKASYSQVSMEVCGQLIWHGKTYKASGNYTATLENSMGCDSIIQLQLTIHSITGNTIHERKDTLFAAINDASAYQWYDCNADTVLKGKTGKFLTGIGTGMYAVIAGRDDCKDTSDCYNYTENSGIKNLWAVSERLLIQPNPNEGIFTVPFEHGILDIYDMQGRLLSSVELAGTTAIDYRWSAPGMYYLVYRNGEQIQSGIWIKN